MHLSNIISWQGGIITHTMFCHYMGAVHVAAGNMYGNLVGRNVVNYTG